MTDLPFLDHGAQLVGRHVHAVEVGQNVATLNFLRHELELAECHLVVLQIGKRHLEDTTFQRIRRNLCK